MSESKIDEYGRTEAHELARKGHIFPVEELLEMGNPADQWGITVAHKMAMAGHVFPINELVQLGNPPDINGETIAHKMASSGHVFSMEELSFLGNPVDKKGRTVAHVMASRKHFFGLNQLLQLGNPPDNHGTTIAHIMALRGYPFSDSELHQLGDLKDVKQNDVSELRLAFCGGEPFFFCGAKKGKKASLILDLDIFDLFDFAYTISLGKNGDTWEATTRISERGLRVDFYEDELSFDEMIAALSDTLASHQDLNFFDFLRYFHIQGQQFSVFIDSDLP